jgi:hypothetical protein
MNLLDYKVLILIVLLFLVFTFKSKKNKEKYSGAITQLISRGPEDIYLTINTDKYVYPYQNFYDRCIGPYCGKDWWYNKYTPFPWNNPTKYPKYFYPSPYVSIHDRYLDRQYHQNGYPHNHYLY